MNIRIKAPNFFRSSLLQINRDKGLTVTTILIMTLTLFITSVFAVISLTANSITHYLESRPQITIFFKSDYPEEKIRAAEKDLYSRQEVSSINFVSKEEAFKFYLGQHQNEQNLLESVSSDIFPPALEVKTQKISDLAPLSEVVAGIEGVDEVVFFKDVINTFRNWVELSRFIGLSLISVLGLISLFIILVTVGMTIRSRAEEIEIMKLLGATDGYVRLPFLTQGSIYGVLSGLFSTAALLILTALFIGRLEPVFSGIPAPPIINFVLIVSLSQVLIGILLGIFGAWLSTKRYLKL